MSDSIQKIQLKKNYNEECQDNSGWKKNAEYARLCKRVKKSKPSFSKGYKFSIDQKQHVLYIYHTLQSNKNFESLKGSSISKLTSLLFGCSENTVKQIINTDGKAEDKRNYKFLFESSIPDEYLVKFMDEISNRLSRGQTVTANHFRTMLQQDGINVSKLTVIRKLKSWNFKWGSLRRQDQRRRKADSITKRLTSLKQLEELEAKGFKNRVYLDESFVHQNHALTEGWFFSENQRSIFIKTGLGDRIAIVAGVQSDGWVGQIGKEIEEDLKKKNGEGVHEHGSINYWKICRTKKEPRESLDTFQASLRSGSKSASSQSSIESSKKKRGNFDRSTFMIYFEDTILSHLTEPSIIILDNAKYHIGYNFNLNKRSPKADLTKYLKKKTKKVDTTLSNEELYTLSKKLSQEKTQIQELAEKNGHRVLYLPPYHPELNSIEYVWAQVKRFVAMQAPYNTKTICEETLPLAFSAIESTDILKIIEHVRGIENMYRRLGDKEVEIISKEIEAEAEAILKHVKDVAQKYDPKYSGSVNQNRKKVVLNYSKKSESAINTEGNEYKSKLRKICRKIDYTDSDAMDIENKKFKTPEKAVSSKFDKAFLWRTKSGTKSNWKEEKPSHFGCTSSNQNKR